ncbi:tellurite resistance TerB family protein [Pectobacterium aquaticum]|uniref:tellurite resistance TerB family protein n=1 Tax=Pectobacterium aquaticum TaxID=2204145 RepID=UPI000E27DB56|nr:tellurite resistance TerB family protein [Pectobacterium aquaticum]RRO06533.1 tellurite resistance TerB family protein [Pectobacterium aquaticum]
MNNWLQQIQGLLSSGSKQENPHQRGKNVNLGDMLKPAALGGLAGVLLSNKSTRKIMGSLGKNALIIGGSAAAGMVLWNQYKKRVRDTHQDDPQFGTQSSGDNIRARRLIQALVFAAKSDGHIDATEKQRIDENIQQLQLGSEAQRWVLEAIEQPLDPILLAKEVKNAEEALEVYFLSCAVIDVDHFMEKSYLDALATELKIPQDVRQSITHELKSPSP